MIRTPPHKQTDPAKRPGVIHFDQIRDFPTKRTVLLPRVEIKLSPIHGLANSLAGNIQTYLIKHGRFR